MIDFCYNFPAVKGIQAGREYFIAMVPLGLLNKLFNMEEEYLLPEYRAQRTINEARIPEISNYILENPNTYVFSALSASIDGNFDFNCVSAGSNIGTLCVDMNAVIIINDGKLVYDNDIDDLKKNSKKTLEQFFMDEGLKRSQQMFADLNKHAVKPSKSLSTLYDDRDDLSNAVKDVVNKISFLSKYVDKEHDSLGKYSSKLFTLANFLRANQRIIKSSIVTKDDCDFLLNYWSAIFTHIEEWGMLEEKTLYKCSLKEDYILTLSVVINAFGRLGSFFYSDKLDLSLLSKLNTIDWSRHNPEWSGRVFNEQGRIIGKEDSITKICNLIKKKLNIELTKEELVKENDIRS